MKKTIILAFFFTYFIPIIAQDIDIAVEADSETPNLEEEYLQMDLEQPEPEVLAEDVEPENQSIVEEEQPAEPTPPDDVSEPPQEIVVEKKKEKKEKIKPQYGTFFMTTGVHSILVTETTNKSAHQGDPSVGAPTAILFSLGFGGHIPLFSFLLFAPHLTFYMNYYLWKDSRPQIAEIEHRTAQTFTFILNLPFLYTFSIKNSIISIGGGIALVARWGMTAQGVPSIDAQHTDLINKYFWSGINYLYPSIQLGFDQILRNGLGIGFIATYYFPLSNAVNQDINMLDGNMISASLKITFPYKVKIKSLKKKVKVSTAVVENAATEVENEEKLP
ncbi:MAG: hypothetical protein ACRC5H_07060 [Treponemataceae bacterium]